MKILRMVILIVGCVLLAMGVRLLYLRSHSTSSDEPDPRSVKISRSVSERSGQKTITYLGERSDPVAESSLNGKKLGIPDSPSNSASPLSIITKKLLMGAVGFEYKQILRAEGLTTGSTWKINSGNLPPGLKIGLDGVIDGIPEEDGEWSFAILLEDGKGNMVRRKFRLLIRPSTMEEESNLLSIVTDSISEGFLGRNYLQEIASAGGEPPYRWAMIGDGLPNGIHLNKKTGVLYGIPREVGKFTFILQLTDGTEKFFEKDFILVVKEGMIEIVTGALPPALKGEKYSLTFRARGGVVPYRWEMVTGRPPEGMKFDWRRGIISGIPEKWGSATFMLRVIGQEGRSSEKKFKLEVTSKVQRITDLRIVTDSLPNAVRGELYNADLTAAKGASPYAWTVSRGELPPSLSLDSGTGMISGIPEQAGASTFTVLVSDNTGNTAQREFNFIVDYQLVYITTGTLEIAVMGSGYQQSITATGGTPPYTFNLESGEMPDNLSLNSVSGKIMGTVSENYFGGGIREFIFQIKATDQVGHYDIVELKMTVRETAEPTPLYSPTPRPSSSPSPIPTASPVGFHISTKSLPDGRVGEDYKTTLSALGGTTPYTWSFNNLPQGLSWSDSGVVSGIPEEIAVYSVAVSVTDAEDEIASKILDLAIIDPQIEGISDLIAAPGDGKIGLAWTNPGTSDFEKVEVLRKTGGYPQHPGDGFVIYEGRNNNIIDDDLTNDNTYFYAVITYNDEGTAGAIGVDNQIEITPREVTLFGKNDPYADEVISFSPLSPSGRSTDLTLGPPEGEGLYKGSIDVVSLHARVYDGTSPCGGNIVLKFSDNIVVNEDGDDFTVFENCFSIKPENQQQADVNDQVWMEPAIISVSQNGRTYYTFPYDYVPHTYSDGTINYYNPYSYQQGFAGLNPVFSNNGSPDPTNPAVSGGDSFDLDDLSKDLKWIQYIKITSTGDGWLTDRQGDSVRHVQDLGACSGGGSSGFDLDAVSAVNY